MKICYLFCCEFRFTTIQSQRHQNVIFLITSDIEQVNLYSFLLTQHCCGENKNILKCITGSDIVMILKQSAAGKTGYSLQLTSLFCQQYFKRLRYNSISMKLLFWCIQCSLLWGLHFILAYCSA